MLTRKAHQEAGKELPEKWLEKLKKLLNQVFGEVSQHEKKSFEVFGKVFPDEVWLATSFLDPSDQTSAPVTYLVSADLVSDQKMETVIDNLIDSIGLFYDVYFSSPD
ncbi:MAG: hypothetical protein HOM21_04900, partial [Halobacteriovoraceae bacterium]|nr:hypothetical protein [Halobacteriovoraceae bacterium]